MNIRRMKRLVDLERQAGQSAPRVFVLENDEPPPADVTPRDIVVRFITNVDTAKL